jgi:hypothetical protein
MLNTVRLKLMLPGRTKNHSEREADNKGLEKLGVECKL